MSTTSINNLASNLTTLIEEMQRQSPANTNSTNVLSALESTSSAEQSDNGQLSPLAQVLGTLQELQQSNPTEYASVTSQISTNLQKAAQTATSEGNTTERPS